MKKEFNPGNLLEPILGEVVSEWMLEILDQLEDQINTISSEDYDDYHEYMEVVGRVTDFSAQLLFHRREQTISMNLEILFHDIQEAMNEFAMLDELEDLESRVFAEISRVIQKGDIEIVAESPTSFKTAVQEITNCYLQRLHSGLQDVFTDIALCV